MGVEKSAQAEVVGKTFTQSYRNDMASRFIESGSDQSPLENFSAQEALRARHRQRGFQELAPGLGGGAGRQNLGLSGLELRAGDKEDSGGPGGKQVEAGEQFGGKGGQEGPVPAEDADEQRSYEHVQHGVGRREAAFGKQRGDTDLNGISDDGNGPG